MSFLTVVIPLYNKQDQIRRSLNSVLSQSFSDFEIVVVDDGSTDNGPHIVKSYTDPRIRLIQQENAGVSAARNRGINEARSPWIAFLDADDEYLPVFLEEVSAGLEKFPLAGAIYADPIWMKADIQLNKRVHSPQSTELLHNYFDYVTLREGNEINSSCVVVNRAVFSKAGLFPVGVKVGEDSDMWMRVAWSTHVAHIPKFLSIYHMDSGDSNWEADALKEAYWVQTYKQWLSQGLIPDIHLRPTEAYYQRYILGKALRLVFMGQKKAARRILFTDVRWKSAPKKYSFKVLLYTFLPIIHFRSILAKKSDECESK